MYKQVLFLSPAFDLHVSPTCLPILSQTTQQCLDFRPLISCLLRHARTVRYSICGMSFDIDQWFIVRDEWQNKLADFEEQLSKAMGIDWKIDIDALAVVPYGAADSWARESPGSMIAK